MKIFQVGILWFTKPIDLLVSPEFHTAEPAEITTSPSSQNSGNIREFKRSSPDLKNENGINGFFGFVQGSYCSLSWRSKADFTLVTKGFSWLCRPLVIYIACVCWEHDYILLKLPPTSYKVVICDKFQYAQASPRSNSYQYIVIDMAVAVSDSNDSLANRCF